MRKEVKTPVVQLLDFEAAAEFFDVPNGMLSKDVKRFEADQRRQSVLFGDARPVYVGVVSRTRHCGGPEEGGWYYDWTQVETIIECDGSTTGMFRDLLWTVRMMRIEYPTCQRGRGSVIGGADVTIYMSRSKKLIEDLQSTEVPRYE